MGRVKQWGSGRVSERYDVVIVGGGPAGAVLAARLSEDPDRTVLLVEAGPDYGIESADWPAEMLDHRGLALDSHSWSFTNKETPAGRRLPLPRARVLGGSSTVNGCIWLRGSRADYDAWEALGNPGWSFDDLLPFFMKAESDSAPSDLHGRSGPVPVHRVADRELSALDVALWDTAVEVGFDALDDFNDSAMQRPGVGKTPKNIVDDRRFNAALSYLAPVRKRSNLTIVADTLIDRVLIDGRHVVGVISSEGQVFAGNEIVLSSGAYGSPAILMRSGIGPADHLSQLDIDPVVDLPGVGSSLMDHPQLARQSGLTSFRIRPECQPGSRAFIQTMIKARSNQVDEEIDLHFYPAETFDERFGCWTLAFGVSLQYSRSKGTVRLTSSDPEAPLDIDHNYFSNPIDLEAICDGYDLMLRIASTPPLSTMLAGPCIEGAHLTSSEALRDVMRAEIGTTYHPSSTCKMGPARDALSVVNAHGQVRGVRGLRVVDASIFPFGPRANLHFTVAAVAEKIAAGIIANR